MTRRPLRALAGRRHSAQAAELTMLGSEHPLVRASDSRRGAVRQSAAVAAVLAGGIAARAASVAWSWALIGAATVVLAALLMVVAAFRQRVRDEAIDLLLAGYQNAPIAAVQNERRRLVSRRTRHALSDTYTTIAHQARPGAGLVLAGARPLFQRAVVRCVVEELFAVGRALEDDQVLAPAVARAERLITNGISSLYGSDRRSLKAELNRILDDLENR